MFKQWQETVERMTKDWEQHAAGWWAEQLQDPKTMERMGDWLNGACEAKERSDRALEEHWGQWRLPSAADVERLYERMGQVRDALERIEDRLSALETPAAAKPAPAKPAPAKKAPKSKKAGQ